MVVKGIVQVTEGDTIVLHGDQDEWYVQCCGCGLWHKYDIVRKGEKIHFKINRLDGEPDFSDVDIKTDIRRGK